MLSGSAVLTTTPRFAEVMAGAPAGGSCAPSANASGAISSAARIATALLLFGWSIGALGLHPQLLRTLLVLIYDVLNLRALQSRERFATLHVTEHALVLIAIQDLAVHLEQLIVALRAVIEVGLALRQVLLQLRFLGLDRAQVGDRFAIVGHELLRLRLEIGQVL